MSYSVCCQPVTAVCLQRSKVLLRFSNFPNDSLLYCPKSEYCETILFTRMGRMKVHSSSKRPNLWNAEWTT